MAKVKLIGSVGVSGKNQTIDIKEIQKGLNLTISLLKPITQLKVDGSLGRNPEKSKTVAAIKEFQKRVVGMVRPDGRVDVNGKTHRKLNDCIQKKLEKAAVKPSVKIPSKIAKQAAKTWDVITDNRIATLHSYVRSPAAAFINAVEEELGIALRITQALRTVEEQDKLYAKGRTTEGKIVTNVKGGYSYHNYGLAIDVVEIKDRKVNWNPDWNAIGKIGVSYGFEWGGNWKSFVDKPHFQMTFGLSIADLVDGERP
ncbi:M15 family metallopeptidase [Vibrio vulnificus]|uniref:M15 family metallopeptidase n=1 Tax=Vibrio vulnificus TaxID=672 RepID=UPI0009BB76F9|nr:M15 family metallopeptidase [Vibrio vulnificus]ELP1878973.1 M15 family metallopeptidase [Vibrio vulnificus]MCA3912789.1 M15 family metallopeptidase [Vibrio vulnificus]